MIKKKNESTWIENVPVLILGMQKDIANVGVFEAVLSVIERPYSYADLMAISSIGLTIKWFRGEYGNVWGGDSLPGDCEDEIQLISQAIGYDCNVKIGDANKIECKKLIIESINNGIPAICLDKGINLAVIFGYENDGDILLVRPYIDSCADMEDWDASVRYAFNDLLPYFILLNESNIQVDKIDAIINGIKIGMNNYNRKSQISKGSFYSKGTYYYGKEAYEKWINDLTNIELYNTEEQASIKFFSWWNSISLMNRRTTMVTVFRNLEGNPYKTLTTKAYVETAKLCTQQVSILEKMNKDNSYNTDCSKWIGQISNDIQSLKLLADIENKINEILFSISDYKDI